MQYENKYYPKYVKYYDYIYNLNTFTGYDDNNVSFI